MAELAVASRIALKMQEMLKELELVPINNERVSPVAAKNIHVRRLRNGDGDRSWQLENHPSIFVTLPKRIVKPADAGENSEDEVYYDVLIQIIDKNYSDEDGMHTYVKWQQTIARLFARTELELGVFDSDGYVYFGHAQSIDTFDEREFEMHSNIVSGVAVRFIANEP